jgi:DHA2 family multidrug resistance protein-like MFS transporter
MTAIADPSAPALKATSREWVGLWVIALPCMVYSMDLTVLNLAIPSLTVDLRPSAAPYGLSTPIDSWSPDF